MSNPDSVKAQILANQANAQHSTGPATPAGKAASSRNRLNHGFRSSPALLRGDDPAEYEALLTDLSQHFGPTDLTDTRFVREMADAEWRLRRVRSHMESALCTSSVSPLKTQPSTRWISSPSPSKPSISPDAPTPPDSATKLNSNGSTAAPTTHGAATWPPNCATPPRSLTATLNAPAPSPSRAGTRSRPIGFERAESRQPP